MDKFCILFGWIEIDESIYFSPVVLLDEKVKKKKKTK